VQLLITAADEIRLEGQVVSLAACRAKLRQYVGQDVVICYEREHAERAASPLAMEVVRAIGENRLAIAFPSEAGPTIDTIMQQTGMAPGPG
jgi:hypothetical protein